MTPRLPSELKVGFNLGMVAAESTWSIDDNDEERKAAWEMYVELITRALVVKMATGTGLVREYLTSAYQMFDITRDILRRYGPGIAEPKPDGSYSFGLLAVATLNQVIRPRLERWHPLLDEWESGRPAGRSRLEHETMWPALDECRADLETMRATLEHWAALLADACGVPQLTAAANRPDLA